MPFPKGRARPANSGRKKGTPNTVTREMRALMESVLFDAPEITRKRLEALRDSEDTADRATFWRLAAKLMPQVVEVDNKRPMKVRVDYVSGRIEEVRDGEEGSEASDGS